MNEKALARGLALTIILMVVLSIVTSRSVLPWKLLSDPSLAIRIIGWYLMVQASLAVLGILALGALPDRDCPICHRGLKTFLSVYGGAVAMCPRCRTLFHKNCWRAKQGRCPICHPEEPDEIEHDFAREFRRPWDR